MKVRINLAEKPGTIGYVMSQHRDEVLGVKSPSEARDLMKRLFEENGINTNASRRILFTLSQKKGYADTVVYLNNVMMKAQQLGTF